MTLEDILKLVRLTDQQLKLIKRDALLISDLIDKILQKKDKKPAPKPVSKPKPNTEFYTSKIDGRSNRKKITTKVEDLMTTIYNENPSLTMGNTYKVLKKECALRKLDCPSLATFTRRCNKIDSVKRHNNEKEEKAENSMPKINQNEFNNIKKTFSAYDNKTN